MKRRTFLKLSAGAIVSGIALLQFKSTGEKNSGSTSYFSGLDDLWFWRAP